MILARHRWLLRNIDTAFEQDFGYGHRCKVCAGHERGDVLVRRDRRDRHLADHRREKIVADNQPTLTMVGSTEED